MKECIVKGCGKDAVGYSAMSRYTAAFIWEADKNNPSTGHLCEEHWRLYWGDADNLPTTARLMRELD